MPERRILTNAIPVRFDVSADYEHGARQQLAVDEEEARFLAFGAIRRAAAIAREADRDWEMMRDPAASAAAYDVRRAIRAAIGSEKANA